MSSQPNLENISNLSDALYGILGRLSDRDAASVFGTSRTFGRFSNDESVFLERFRMAFGNRTYRQLRNVPGTWKEKYIIAQNMDQDPDLIERCDRAGDYERSLEFYLCNSSYFTLKYLRSKYGSAYEVAERGDTFHFAEYVEADPLSIADPDIYNAAVGIDRRPNLAIVEMLLQAGIPLPEETMRDIIRMLIQDSLEGLELLLTYKVIPKDYFDPKVGNILHILASSSRDSSATLKILLQDQAFQNLVNENNAKQETPAILALKKGNDETFETLILRARDLDFAAKDEEGNTIFSLYIEKDILDPNLFALILNRSPLSGKLIEEVESADRLRFFLEETPLGGISYAPSRDIRYTLAVLYNDAQYDPTEDPKAEEEAEIERLLESYDAKIVNVNQRSPLGNTILVRVIQNHPTNPKRIEERKRSLEIIRNLLENGSDPNNSNKDGETALFFARGDMDILNILKEYDADFNHISAKGDSVLIANILGTLPISVPNLSIESLRKILSNSDEDTTQRTNNQGENAIDYLQVSSSEDFAKFKVLVEEYKVRPSSDAIVKFSRFYDTIAQVVKDLEIKPEELTNKSKAELLIQSAYNLSENFDVELQNIQALLKLEIALKPKKQEKVLKIIAKQIRDFPFKKQEKVYTTMLDSDVLDLSMVLEGDWGGGERSLLSVVAEKYQDFPEQIKIVQLFQKYDAKPYAKNEEGEPILSPEVLNPDTRKYLYPELYV